MSPLLTIREAAATIGVNPEVLRRWCRQGIGPPIAGRVGTGVRARYRFRRSALMDWLDSTAEETAQR